MKATNCSVNNSGYNRWSKNVGKALISALANVRSGIAYRDFEHVAH